MSLSEKIDIAIQEYVGFSNPYEKFQQTKVEEQCINESKKRCRELIKLAQQRNLDFNLLAVISEGSQSIRSLKNLWRPEFGVIFNPPGKNSSKFNERLAELALGFHSFNIPGTWKIPIVTTIKVLFFGRIISLSEFVAVEIDENKKVIWTKENGRDRRFVWEQENVVLQQSGFIPVRITPLRYEEKYSQFDESKIKDLEKKVSAGLKLVSETSSDYGEWVTRLAVSMLPLEQEADRIKSWSSSAHPGMLAMCCSGDTLDIADSLIHETSHQHLHLLSFLKPLIKPNSDTLYFSPVKGRERPLSKLLLAYHAFGNILLFFRTLRNSGLVDDSWYVENAFHLVTWTAQMESTLRKCNALTCAGNCLWVPLAARLSESDI